MSHFMGLMSLCKLVRLLITAGASCSIKRPRASGKGSLKDSRSYPPASNIYNNRTICVAFDPVEQHVFRRKGVEPIGPQLSMTAHERIESLEPLDISVRPFKYM